MTSYFKFFFPHGHFFPRKTPIHMKNKKRIRVSKIQFINANLILNRYQNRHQRSSYSIKFQGKQHISNVVKFESFIFQDPNSEIQITTNLLSVSCFKVQVMLQKFKRKRKEPQFIQIIFKIQHTHNLMLFLAKSVFMRAYQDNPN
ncbi:unnamed protein product [Lathyrus sativus]|nr:unnamed protein product [Lathyrus sativus]